MVGTVWDPAGEAFPGATLTAVEQNTGRQFEAVTDGEGDYAFPSLAPGSYTVTVRAKGYKDVVRRSISLLTPGTIEEIFTIEAAALDEDSIVRESPRARDSDVSAALSIREIQARPVLERNPLSQVIYQPGLQINPENENYSNVNGSRRAMSNFVLDGITISDPVNPSMEDFLFTAGPETISEVQIVTSGAKAEYGRTGGGQFVLVSRPGTRSWAGNVYDYVRNKNLNANDFSNNAAGISRPKFDRHIFGGTLSGPIRKDKTLFFMNYEGNRTDREVGRNRLVLSDEAREGVFRWFTPDDATRDESTMKTYNIPTHDPRGIGIDPKVAAILTKLPTSNNTLIGDGLNTAGYRFNSAAHLYQDQITGRVDHALNPNHNLFVRFNWDRADGTDLLRGGDSSFPGETEAKFQRNYFGFTGGSDWTVNPKMVNEFRIGYLAPTVDQLRPGRSTGDMFRANSWTDPLNSSFPGSHQSRVLQLADSISHVKGKHIFKYGVDFKRTSQGLTDYRGVYPTATLGLDFGNAPASTIGPSEYANISIEDRLTFEKLYNDLLGRIESVSQTFNSTLTSVFPAGTAKRRDFSFQEYAGYIQDDWRIRTNLTLNLGLRYEFSTVPDEKGGYQSVLSPAPQSDASAITNFTVRASNAWREKSIKDFAPRAGFAWDIFSTGSTVLRGSYGIYYDRLIGAITNFVDENSYGFSQTREIHPNAASGADVRLSEIPAVSAPSAPTLQLPATRSQSIALFDPKLRTPRVDQYNVFLARRMGPAVLEIGYVGARGRRLFQYANMNQTKSQGEFLQAFKELKAYRDDGIAVPSSNVLLRVFGTPQAALTAVGGSNLDTNQVGVAADNMDLAHYDKYAAAGLADTYIRNFPQFDKFIVGTSSGESWYKSVQAGIRASGDSYQVRAHYTWSRSSDTASSDGETWISPSNSFNIKSNKAPSDFDRAHSLNLALDYRIPFGKSRSEESDLPGWADAFFGGWNVGALYYMQSGDRFSVYSGRQTAYAGVDSYANYSGSLSDGNLYRRNGRIYWFNQDQVAEFTNPEAGSLGNTGRNAFIGPRYMNLDVSLFKHFYIGERQSIQFRVEGYNVFNHTQFRIPDANRSSSTFGTFTSTLGAPRSLQVALKYQF